MHQSYHHASLSSMMSTCNNVIMHTCPAWRPHASMLSSCTLVRMMSPCINVIIMHPCIGTVSNVSWWALILEGVTAEQAAALHGTWLRKIYGRCGVSCDYGSNLSHSTHTGRKVFRDTFNALGPLNMLMQVSTTHRHRETDSGRLAWHLVKENIRSLWCVLWLWFKFITLYTHGEESFQGHF